MGNGLRRGRWPSGRAEGVEQKRGFLALGPRLWSADWLREISWRGLMEELAFPAADTEFSALDTRKALGGLRLEGPRILELPEAPLPGTKSSEELSTLTAALENLGLETPAPLRRVTKRPTEGGSILKERR